MKPTALIPYEGVDGPAAFFAALEQRFERNRRNGYGTAFGAEIEGHLHVGDDPMPALRGPEFLQLRAEQCSPERRAHNGSDSLFAPEVHLGRIEALTVPAPDVDGMMAEVTLRLQEIDETAARMGLNFRCDPIIPIPDDHETVVLPELLDSERYQALSPQAARAALSVAALQFQRGCQSMDQALGMYEAVRRALPDLRFMGDLTDGRRQRLYELWVDPEMARPPVLRNRMQVYAHARRYGWVNAPKGWWSDVRINMMNGTVELRSPDASRDLAHIRTLGEAFAHITAPYA